MIDKEALMTEFKGNKDLQVEFGDDFEAFFALKKHEYEVDLQTEKRNRRRAMKPR